MGTITINTRLFEKDKKRTALQDKMYELTIEGNILHNQYLDSVIVSESKELYRQYRNICAKFHYYKRKLHKL